MLNLLISEFSKIKRQKFIQLSLFAALLFPIPLTLVMSNDQMSFDHLFRANMIFGELLFLPCILGIIATVLFFMERDHDTFKNLLTIPVSATKIVLAKLLVIMLLSVLYSMATLGATIIGGVILGGVDGILYRIIVSIVLGLLIAIATFPVVIVIIYFSKSYVFSIIVSFIYAVIGFIVTMTLEMFSTISIFSILPIPIIFRWYLTLFPLEQELRFIEPYLMPTSVAFLILGIYGLIAVGLMILVYKRKE